MPIDLKSLAGQLNNHFHVVGISVPNRQLLAAEVVDGLLEMAIEDHLGNRTVALLNDTGSVTKSYTTFGQEDIDIREYPEAEMMLNPSAEFEWNCVGSTYLEMYYALVTPITAILIQSYSEYTVEELEQFWNANGKSRCAPEFQDDVLVFCESKDYWWMFWFDRDSSECALNRILKTRQPFNDFIASWLSRVKSHASKEQWKVIPAD